MIKTIKVMLCPNNKQRTKLFECAGTARFVYNRVLDYEQINYECDRSFINDNELRKRLTASRKTNKQKFNCIRLAEKNRIPVNAKYSNPRVTFDGLNRWISVGIEAGKNTVNPVNNGIGIDIGIKTLAVCSDTEEYKNINKTEKVRKLKKKKRRLQRKISRKYCKNKKGVCYRKTCNIIKSEKQLLKTTRRLTNIRHNYIHEVTSEIVNRQPKFIVTEDLNVKGMMKNKYLAKAVQEQCFYKFYRQLQYKCYWNNIDFVTADRDYQASVNLMRYYELTT